MKKRLIFATIIILLSAAAAGYWFLVRSSGDSGQTQTGSESAQPAVQDDGKLRLIASGDMIAHDSINAAAKLPDGSYDYLALMTAMEPFFEAADVRFCNQATMAGGQSFGISGYPVFNAPFDFTHDLVGLGCNVVNIGTNHTNDRGQKLIDAAVTEWDRQRGLLAVSGANRSAEEQQRLRTFEVENVKFAFLAYSTYSNVRPANAYGLNMYDRTTAKKQVEAAHQAADIVIVSMRWGTEYSPDVNPQQNQIAQDLAGFGADIILGHGPHVLEPVKRIKGRDGAEALVWFSLGNFLNSQIDIESLIGGVAVMDIDKTTKQVTDVSFLPVYQHYEWTAAQKKAEDLMARQNFMMVPLDQAADLLARSQHGTSVEEQSKRVQKILNTYTEVPLIRSAEY